MTNLANHIEESLIIQTHKFSNIIHFVNDIMTNRMHIKVEQHLRYNLNIWNKKGDFDILNYIREYFTLVQEIDTLVNVNRTISIVCYWIFESSYEKAMFLTKKSMDLVCYPSVGEKQVAKLETVFYAVRYMWEPIDIKIG